MSPGDLQRFVRVSLSENDPNESFEYTHADTHVDTQEAAESLSESSMLAQLIGPSVTEAEPERYLHRCWRRCRREGRGRHLADGSRSAVVNVILKKIYKHVNM